MVAAAPRGFVTSALTMQDLEQMYSSEWNQEINEHKAERCKWASVWTETCQRKRGSFGEIRSFVANDKMREFARP